MLFLVIDFSSDFEFVKFVYPLSQKQLKEVQLKSTFSKIDEQRAVRDREKRCTVYTSCGNFIGLKTNFRKTKI